MVTTCKACGGEVIARVWLDGRAVFIEMYRCGSVLRWGEDPAVLQPCPHPMPRADATDAEWVRRNTLPVPDGGAR